MVWNDLQDWPLQEETSYTALQNHHHVFPRNTAKDIAPRGEVTFHGFIYNEKDTYSVQNGT